MMGAIFIVLFCSFSYIAKKKNLYKSILNFIKVFSLMHLSQELLVRYEKYIFVLDSPLFDDSYRRYNVTLTVSMQLTVPAVRVTSDT